ncbi:MAG: leucine-rich repeat domain-containing protein [Solobacterium sp.]|nr:leucine-rich repeat domain-containing protein [Solobacterium sp.]
MYEIENYDHNCMTIDHNTGILVKFKGSRHRKPVVKIPRGVTAIGPRAFANSHRFTGVIIPETVTSIKSAAFRNCPYLTRIKIPGSVKYIKEKAFELCENLRDVTIEEGVQSIGDLAFSECGSLTAVDLPDSIEYIGMEAFSACKGLRSFRIPKGVCDLKDTRLLDVPWIERVEIDEDNASYVLRDGVLFSRDLSYLLYYPKRKQDEVYTVPGTVRTIGRFAFASNKYLREVILEDGVTRIMEGAFENCTYLTFVTIPPSVTDMGYMVFLGAVGAGNKNWRYPGLDIYDSIGKIIRTLNSIGTEEGVVIRGRKDSTAYEYAEKNGLYFIEMQ